MKLPTMDTMDGGTHFHFLPRFSGSGHCWLLSLFFLQTAGYVIVNVFIWLQSPIISHQSFKNNCSNLGCTVFAFAAPAIYP